VDFSVQPDKRLWISFADVNIEKGVPIVVSIDYEAAPSDHLRPVGRRNGDPLTIRALHTDSEPLGARDWMPVHDEPGDRAYFSVSMRMDPNESLIANGTLTNDENINSSRHMRYETAYPLPAYLMAFAVSEFQAESTKFSGLPIEVFSTNYMQMDCGQRKV
jgi:aminopeptidase N